MGSNTFRLVVFRYRPRRIVPARRRDPRRRAPVGRRRRGGPAPGGARARRPHGPPVRAPSAPPPRWTTWSPSPPAPCATRPTARRRSAALSADGGARRARALRRGGGLVRLPRRGQLHHPAATGTCSTWAAAASRSAQVAGRSLERSSRAPLGAVRMTEALPARAAGEPRRPQGRCAATCRGARRASDWLAGAGRPDGRRRRHDPDAGRACTSARRATRSTSCTATSSPRRGIEDLIDDMAALPAAERSRLPGLKPDRADITLAGAVVISTVLDAVGVDGLEICGQGLREGIFYERFLAPARPAPVRGRAPPERAQPGRHLPLRRAPRRARRRAGPRRLRRAGAAGPADRRPARARAAVGRRACSTTPGVLVDYNDHHKHGYYLVLNAGPARLPPPRAGADRAAGAGPPQGAAEPRAARGRAGGRRRGPAGAARLLPAHRRAAGARARRRRPRGARSRRPTGRVGLIVRAEGDPAVAVWSAALEAAVFQRAFGRRLEISAGRAGAQPPAALTR